jgi:hypothetical protein
VATADDSSLAVYVGNRRLVRNEEEDFAGVARLVSRYEIEEENVAEGHLTQMSFSLP